MIVLGQALYSGQCFLQKRLDINLFQTCYVVYPLNLGLDRNGTIRLIGWIRRRVLLFDLLEQNTAQKFESPCCGHGSIVVHPD